MFLLVRVEKQIFSPTVNTKKIKKIFYCTSIPILAALLTLTVATKTYLRQIDIQEKAEYDKVLADFVAIFHPELMPKDYKPTFYQLLK